MDQLLLAISQYTVILYKRRLSSSFRFLYIQGFYLFLLKVIFFREGVETASRQNKWCNFCNETNQVSGLFITSIYRLIIFLMWTSLKNLEIDGISGKYNEKMHYFFIYFCFALLQFHTPFIRKTKLKIFHNFVIILQKEIRQIRFGFFFFTKSFSNIRCL